MYLKFIAQVAATIAAAIAAALTDGRLTPAEGVQVAILGLGAVSVLGAGNLPAGVWRYTKSIVAAASAAAVLLASSLSGGVTASEWLLVGIGALGAVGVYAVPGPLVRALARTAGPQTPGVADHAA